MSDESHQPASMGQVKAIIRRKLRKQEPQEEQFLNIYPMMDMMTILLVFLVAQFATDSAQVVQSEELMIPFSRSEISRQPALEVTIARDQIMVANVQVVQLRNGQVDPSQKQGGSTGFLINPLLEQLREHRELARIRDNQRGAEFAGEVAIIADRRTPYRTITEVLYTLGQAEFKAIRFLLIDAPSSG